MKIYQGIADLDTHSQNCVTTVGNFDGVHIGHQKIFRSLVECAKKQSSSVPTVVTFRPHPQVALQPKKSSELINTYGEKMEFLEKYGIELVIEEPFSRDFSNTSPKTFLEDYLLKKLNVSTLYLGHDFAFGKNRTGTVDFIQAHIKERIKVCKVEPFAKNGVVVSSSKIRALLESGEVGTAHSYLGRYFFIRGIIVKGHGRGTQINVPTTNLDIGYRKIPRQGVYATYSLIDGKKYLSITNVGKAPTFQSMEKKPPITVETHILNFTGNVYGKKQEVQFVDFIREEKRFPGAKELVEQIHRDMEKAKSILSSS